jgi:putative endonuclease
MSHLSSPAKAGAFDDLDAARHRELQMKEWKRAWKLRVIEEMNPHWRDLFEDLF